MQQNKTVTQVAYSVAKSRRFRYLMGTLVFMTIFLGMIIVPVEIRFGRSGNILNMEDGLWWAITTVTGVGYGDHYPVTTAGRVIGVVLQTFGVVLFGAIVAVVSISLLRYQEDFYIRRIMSRMDATDDKIDELKRHIDYIIRDNIDKK